jgi:integrase
VKEKLTRDATGQYRRDLGWKPTDRGYAQHRFYLGRDLKRAKRIVRRLEVLWEQVVARWEQVKGSERPVWDEATLAMAKGIVDEAKEIRVPLPLLMPGEDKTLSIENFALWLSNLVRDFPGLNLTLDDERLRQNIANLRSTYEEKAGRLQPVYKSGQTLHEALDAYKAWLHGRHLTPPEPGREQRTSQTGVKQGERVERLKQHVQDMPLSEFGLKQIEDVVAYWAKRPVSTQGKPFSPITCKHQIRLWKHFTLWLHKEPTFDWRRPADLVWDRVSILEHPHEVAARATPDQVDTYSKEELKTLWEYSTDTTRVLMALALNCGFGIGEIGTLTRSEVQGEYIKRIRWKSKVYGEWRLWPVTQELLATLPPNETKWLLVTRRGTPLIEPTKSNFRGAYIPNRWATLLRRIREDHPDFRRLSFNKLRKTAGNLIRQFADGEVAGVFLCHGQAVRTDDLADVYTNRPFDKVFKAQQQVWDHLKDIFVGEVIADNKISVGTIKKIKELHRKGLPVSEIAKQCGVAESTVRDHTRTET